MINIPEACQLAGAWLARDSNEGDFGLPATGELHQRRNMNRKHAPKDGRESSMVPFAFASSLIHFAALRNL